MKGFVLLAALLLVPSMAYFQKLAFESSLRDELRQAVEAVLVAEGVEGATVRMKWLDAIIAGNVESEERRLEVAAAVGNLEAVRVPRDGNRLRAQGWLQIGRQNGKWSASWVLPHEFDIQLPAGANILEEGSDMRRSSYVVAPAGAFEWGEFLEEYFRGPGNRSVTMKAGRLLMEGDSTVGLRADWLAEASGVVGKEAVDERFTLYPSEYHLPEYTPVSLKDTNELERLRRQLQFGAVAFEPGEGEVPASESGKVSAIATAILSSGDRVRYVVGGHPPMRGGAPGGEELALRRAEEVLRLLREYGVAESQLEATAFGWGSESGLENRVEVLVK